MLRSRAVIARSRAFLQPASLNATEQLRTTYILKRRFPPGLDKKYGPPKPLKARHYIYDLEEDTNSRKEPDLKLILTSYVDGVGMKNDVVSVRPNFGRTQLLLPGLAVYASPENLEKLSLSLRDVKKEPEEAITHSSRFAELTKRDLAKQILEVLVHIDNPWTIEKWHIRSAFRRSGFWVPDHAIKMGDRTISGPNLDIEKRVFLVQVTVNNLETTPVRCMVRHWSSTPESRLPKVEGHLLPPYQPVFEDEKEIISSLPLPSFCKKASQQ